TAYQYQGSFIASPVPSSGSSETFPPTPTARGIVFYRKKVRVTERAVRELLQKIADHFGWMIIVTSGDRDHVPRGVARRRVITSWVEPPISTLLVWMIVPPSTCSGGGTA